VDVNKGIKWLRGGVRRCQSVVRAQIKKMKTLFIKCGSKASVYTSEKCKATETGSKT